MIHPAASASQAEFERQALEFARDVSATTRSVLGEATEPFQARGVSYDVKANVVVRQDSRRGLELTVDSVPVLRLKASLSCTWDHRQAYLAVEKSRFEVLALADSEPLFRVDYLRSPEGTVPSAHLQVHAHRDAVSHAMTICGQGSRRSKRRGRSAEQARRIPRLAQLHFPLGGHRFRPCIEDILEMLVDEFGVASEPGALQAIAAGRARWRRNQLGAAVRDSPETAVRILEELGYVVTPPPAGPAPERENKLQAY